MNIVILGAGAVGGYLGCRLLEAGKDAVFLVRDGRAEQLRDYGLKLESVQGSYSAGNVAWYTDANDIPACDVVLVTVKGYHVEGAMPQLETLVRKGAKILPFLNGMEHFETFQRAFGKENVIGGLAYIIATLDSRGWIVHTSEMHHFIFGALDPSQAEFCRELESEWRSANVKVTNSDDISTMLWQKYAFITAFSGATTASRLEIGTIRDTPAALALFRQALREMKELAKANGVVLDKRFEEEAVERIHGLPANGTSSMHQDFRKGVPIEVEALQGGAIRMAEAKGIDLPTVRTLYALLKPYEHGPVTG
ncbi:MAG TPA: ketopantoate reductase family protein [Bacillales bacterium]|nr:ketopantoate reductase family protein [Bacillales bacterium]